MKKKLWMLGIMFCLLLSAAVPVLAKFDLSLYYTMDQVKDEFVSRIESKEDKSLDFDGALFGLGYSESNVQVKLDFLEGKLDEMLAGDNTIKLQDWRFGYQFYQNNDLGILTWVTYLNEECGDLKARGPSFGLGCEYILADKWSTNFRLGYSPIGVRIKSGSVACDDTSLATVGAGIKYQVSDSCAAHIDYRYYGFFGKNDGVDVKNRVEMLLAGVSFKFDSFSQIPFSPEPSPEEVQ